jgi:aspartyl-tRNA(Asn)/glutamyl-tRNA(Gln) amidotransferase subunit C
MSAPQLDVRYVAHLARLHLTEEEITKFQSQLGKVLDYVAELNEVDVTGVEPTAHTNPVVNVLRPDVAIPWFTTREALANAPQSNSDLFIVTKVVE